MLKPMLASPAPEPELIRFPVWVSPKLDGVRALVINGKVYSRSLKLIPNEFVQRLFGNRALNGLDGELIVGPETHPNVMQATMSGVMRETGEPDVSFQVFDDFTEPTQPYWERVKLIGNKVRAWRTFVNRERSRLVVVDQQVVDDVARLNELEEIALATGYEGLMLRDPAGQYKYGRSTTKEGILLKLKRFVDSEAEVIGFEEKMHNANAAETNELGRTKRSTHAAGLVPAGTLGALLVRDLKTGVEFSIGTGFDDPTRALLWATKDSTLGRVTKYKSFPTGVKDKPRFPVYLGFRDERDL